MKKIILSFLAITTVAIANAQTPYILSGTNYTQNFDAIASGLPQGWRVDSLVNKNAGLGNDASSKFSPTAVSWGGSTSRGFKNVASANTLTATATTADQSAATDRALGIRQVSATGWDDKDSLTSASFNIANTTGLSSFSLQFKIMSLHTGAKRYNNWIVQYGIGSAPATFTTIATTPATLTIDSNFSNTSVSVNFGTALDNVSQPVWIRIMPSDTTMGSGTRPLVGVDNFSLSWTGTAVNNTPQYTSFTPADNSVNVPTSTTSLGIAFDKNITIGTGNVTVYNITDVTNQVIAASSCTVSGMNVTIPGVTLVTGKDYAVQFDSTCFKYTTYNGIGVYNNTTWNFSTPAAVNPPVNSLNETFTGCIVPTYGSFTAFSEVGASQNWRCSTFGHTDSNAVYMNGYGNSMSNDNTDWLISPNLNISAMANPMLNFWAKRRFAGTTTKEVWISSNYTGDVTTATWTNLNVTGLSTLDTVGWVAFNNTSLNSYKANNFVFAFKYGSLATGTSDEWTIDDVNITDGPVSVKNIALETVSLKVLGEVSNNLTIELNSTENSNYHLQIMDMLGNVIVNNTLQVNKGINRQTIAIPSTAVGVYVIKLQNDKSIGELKFVKQ